MQSSVSEWSKFQARDVDARGANNGVIDGKGGFHTGLEASPWWQVDLQSICVLREVRLFNRQHCAARLRRFSILTSLDGARWAELFHKTDDAVFGEHDLHPYVAALPEDSLARFVRIRLDGTECLHFCECQVLGQVADAASLATLDPEVSALIRAQAEREQRREAALRDGRRGHVVTIENLTIFVDTDRYSPTLVQSLTDGGYEWRERALVSELLRADDRVLDIGTAIGVVAMMAAKVVGPANVVTYDANPQIVADAQRNFAVNDLASIRAQVGVLQNRAHFANTPTAVDFFISRDFWASRLVVGVNRQDIGETVSVPTTCLEDQIAAHRATVIVCDIEGGEVDLLNGADLAGIRLLIIEVHDFLAGRQATDAMIRHLVALGFNVDFHHSGNGIAVLHR